MLPDFKFSYDLFKKYGLELTSEVYNKLDIYAEFLVAYNENVNLTAITDGKEILIKHFLDSILICKYCDIKNESTIIDVGTGAGFPSVPLKIYRPDLKITLLDSLNKRIIFLEELCKKLSIDAEFFHSRAEECGKNCDLREQFDIATARAVANLGLLSEYCMPFVKVDGKFISMKGPNEDIKLGENAVKTLGGRICEDITYELEGDKRRIVVVEKISQTPTKYPRNSAQIKKKSL